MNNHFSPDRHPLWEVWKVWDCGKCGREVALSSAGVFMQEKTNFFTSGIFSQTSPAKAPLATSCQVLSNTEARELETGGGGLDIRKIKCCRGGHDGRTCEERVDVRSGKETDLFREEEWKRVQRTRVWIQLSYFRFNLHFQTPRDKRPVLVWKFFLFRIVFEEGLVLLSV